MFTLSTAGSAPMLTDAILAAQLSDGELVLSMQVVLGQYVVLATTAGIRVGTITTSGNIQYGAILYPMPGAVLGPVVANDRYAYVGSSDVHGTAGVVRVDLSTQTDSSRWAWSYDQQTGITGSVTGIAFTSSGIVLGVGGSGVWRDSGTTVSSGYLLTGNIRFHIEANKLFKYVNVSTQPLTGSVRVSRVLPSGVESTVAQYGERGLTFSPDVLMYDPPTEYCAYRFTLTPDANGNSPVFNAY